MTRYASHRAIMRAAARKGLAPRPPVNVAEYAAEHRWLNNTGGGYVGRWRHEMTPYLVDPMADLNSLDHLTVCVVGPGQSGKTSIPENWLLQSVGTNPAKMLWLMQTDDAVEAYVKDRINPMIDDHEVLRKNQGPRPVDDSLHFKRFRTMSVEFLSATLRNLINKSAPRIVLDEIDAYPDGLGDVVALADVRRQTFGMWSKILAISHPDKARGLRPDRDWTAGIMAVYADSDRRVWYWACPHCGSWSSPAPIADRVMLLKYPEEGSLDEIAAAARLVCPINNCEIENHHRHAMNIGGRWIGRGQEISQAGAVTGELVHAKTAGFWIVGVMSPFLLGGIGGLARARVKAERELEISGEEETLRQVMVKQWGVPYAPPKSLGSIDANTLAERADPDLKLGIVPDGVRFLTVAVDCQIAHFEYLVRGWGVGGESWIIDRGRIAADPATSAQDWDQLLDLFTRGYPLGDGSGRAMTARAAVYDSAGAPGVTQQAYAAWSRWRKARAVRMFGMVSGRDCWSIIPTKGDSGINAPRLQVVYPDTSRKANVKAGAGAVPLARFNPNAFKDDLRGQFLKADVGPWHVHFPAGLLGDASGASGRQQRSKDPPHVWFEQAVAEDRDPKSGRWVRVSPSARNEALDLMVMTHIAAHLHGLARINWERPPSWSQAWDTNSTIVGVAAAVPIAATAAKSAASPTPAAGETKKPNSISTLIDKFK